MILTPYEVFWLFAVPVTLFSWYHISRHALRYIPPDAKLPPDPHPRIIFQIAARTLTPIVRDPLDSIKRSCSEVGFSNYEIRLVVDRIETPVDGVETVLVPGDFTSLSKFKARALHYALRYLPNSENAWILHLDEDAQVTPQCVSSILSYIAGGGNPVANGPTVFPYDGNVLTFYAEAQRQWTFYWLKDQVQSSIVHWLNGSNLLIRSDIEQTMGWDFINCIYSEDSRFGYEATKKLGKVFGWHGGLTIEKPPATLKGLMKQRMRWFFGSILNLRYVPKGRLPRRLYSITAWLNGFVLTIFFFLIVAGLYQEPWFADRVIVHGFTISSTIWLGRYQIGVYQNLRYTPVSRVKKALFHLGIIPLAPFIDMLCTIPAIWALIRPPRKFEVTSKRT